MYRRHHQACGIDVVQPFRARLAKRRLGDGNDHVVFNPDMSDPIQSCYLFKRGGGKGGSV